MLNLLVISCLLFVSVTCTFDTQPSWRRSSWQSSWQPSWNNGGGGSWTTGGGGGNNWRNGGGGSWRVHRKVFTSSNSWNHPASGGRWNSWNSGSVRPSWNEPSFDTGIGGTGPTILPAGPQFTGTRGGSVSGFFAGDNGAGGFTGGAVGGPGFRAGRFRSGAVRFDSGFMGDSFGPGGVGGSLGPGGVGGSLGPGSVGPAAVGGSFRGGEVWDGDSGFTGGDDFGPGFNTGGVQGTPVFASEPQPVPGSFQGWQGRPQPGGVWGPQTGGGQWGPQTGGGQWGSSMWRGRGRRQRKKAY